MYSSIALCIQHYAKETPESTAIIVNDEKCSYGYLAQCSRKAAHYLQRQGVKAGDRIIVEADHSLPYIYFWYGIQLLGACFVPLEKRTPSKRMLEIAAELDTEKIVSLTSRDDLPGSWSLTDINEEILDCDDSFEPVEPEADSLAEILFTTGTTGKSKGVMVSYANQVNIALAGIETTNILPDNVWLIPTPLNHAAGLRKIHIAMAVGSAACLLDGFRNFKLFFKTIHDHRVSSLYLPPSAIHMFLALASKNLAELNSQLRFIYSSSAAYPEQDKEKMRKLLPDVYMYNCFGCSEVGVVCTDEFCVSGGSVYPGSVGRPNSQSEIVILNEDGSEKTDAGPQNPGLVAIRSKSVAQGYWNEHGQTARAFRDGMLIMSDLCYCAPNGELILVGRSHDPINLGGLKIAPTEVEELVSRVSCVDEALVIPVVKDGSNVALKLLVVLKEGEDLDEAAIRKLIEDNLEP
ncbi:MAG: acyl--CoA ligase, partial [Oscillospiraceae bacterium]|nr:acyl--CoA ligase [Oscillospiraceae bacterium]